MYSDLRIRFDGVVRRGIRFRKRLDAIKRRHPEVQWYPYDSFANLFPVVGLLRSRGVTLAELAGGSPVLDVGAGDGDLAFYLESLGYEVDAIDNSGTNMNRMLGARTLAAELRSKARLLDFDLDSRFEMQRRYGLSLMLGVLYHLKNPFYALEQAARCARYCILSTRVARWTPDHSVGLDAHPLAYLLDEAETNNDKTNYWIFSPAGLDRLVSRCGWSTMAKEHVGSPASDPVHPGNDERVFLLMKSLIDPHP